MNKTATLTLLALVLTASFASAQCQTYGQSYYTPTYNYTPTVVKKNVVVQDIVYTRYIAAIPLLDLPTYGAYYTPAPVVAAPAAPAAAPAAAAATPCATDSARILKLMEAMDARMTRLEAASTKTFAPAPPPKESAPAGSVDLRRVNQQKCAMCHARGNEKKGGDFILSEPDGTLVRLTDGQLADLQTHVVKGTMPKLTAASRAAGVTALTVDEAEAFIEEARRQRGVARASIKK